MHSTNGYNGGYHNRNYGERLDSYTDVKCEVNNNSLDHRGSSAERNSLDRGDRGSSGVWNSLDRGDRGSYGAWVADSSPRRVSASGRNAVPTAADGRYYYHKSFVISGKDLNSPESYDSGIQDDTSEPQNYNMYAVIKKNKSKSRSSNGDMMSPRSVEEYDTNGYPYNGNDSSYDRYGGIISSTSSIPQQNRRKLSPMLENRNYEDEGDEYDDAFEENERPGADKQESSSLGEDNVPIMHSRCKVQHKNPIRQAKIYENEDNQIRSKTLENKKTSQSTNYENTERTFLQNERTSSQNERTSSQNERTSSQNERTSSQNERTTSLSSSPRSPLSSRSTSLPLETFAVSLLGSLPLTQEDMSADRTVASINRCILAFDKKQKHSVAICLQIIGEQLELKNSKTEAVIRTHSIKSIRNWGIGKDKDSPLFAYVVRDKTENEYTCWVFSAKKPAQRIASALRNACIQGVTIQKKSSSTKEDDSPIEMDQPKFQNNNLKPSNSISVPIMDSTKNTFYCRYLGLMKVPKAFGMDVLNTAMETLYKSIPIPNWLMVDVDVSPSAVVVVDHQNPNSVIFDCRIRYLTFLGIATNNTKLGSFIMHTADDEFFAHVFYVEPSAAIFSRIITAACNLRYQKCLDARAQQKKEAKMDRNMEYRKARISSGQQPGFNRQRSSNS